LQQNLKLKWLYQQYAKKKRYQIFFGCGVTAAATISDLVTNF